MMQLRGAPPPRPRGSVAGARRTRCCWMASNSGRPSTASTCSTCAPGRRSGSMTTRPSTFNGAKPRRSSGRRSTRSLHDILGRLDTDHLHPAVALVRDRADDKVREEVVVLVHLCPQMSPAWRKAHKGAQCIQYRRRRRLASSLRARPGRSGFRSSTRRGLSLQGRVPCGPTGWRTA